MDFKYLKENVSLVLEPIVLFHHDPRIPLKTNNIILEVVSTLFIIKLHSQNHNNF